jgi:hypothetical protein
METVMNSSITADVRARRRPTLTKEEMFDLWKAAIKDDDGFVNEVIQTVYDNLMAFNDERTRNVMELMVRREPVAPFAFQSLLTQARVSYSRSVTSGPITSGQALTIATRN